MKEHRKRIIENYVKSYNDFDLEGMIKNMDENIVFENVSNGEVEMRLIGLEEFTKQAQLAKQGFKERKQTIESWKFEDSKVSIDIKFEAILALDFPNGFQAGDVIELQGVSVFEFSKKKIKKITDKS